MLLKVIIEREIQFQKFLQEMISKVIVAASIKNKVLKKKVGTL